MIRAESGGEPSSDLLALRVELHFGAETYHVLKKVLHEKGLSTAIGDSLSGTFGGMGPWVVLSAIYLLSVIMTEFLSNNTVAIILTPIAIETARHLGVDPRPFAIAVMFGATLAFSTPIGYQTNLLVYNAGGYKFGDFARIGIPLTILLWILCSLLIPLIWPLTPLP